jgi:hypothetical protein
VVPRCTLSGPALYAFAMLLHRRLAGGEGFVKTCARRISLLRAFRPEVLKTAPAPRCIEPPPGPGAFFRRLMRYSSAHLAAGLFHTWHRRVLTMDILLVATLLGCLVFWPLGALAIVLGLGRLARTISLRSANVAPRNPWRPDRLVRVLWLLLLADVAVWGGLARWWAGYEDH